MTTAQILEVVDKYRIFIRAVYPDLSPKLAPFDGSPNRKEAAAHLLTMCDEIGAMLDSYETEAGSHEDWEKANRWLGFMQGAFWILRSFSLNEMRKHNNPDCEGK
jgi:hypothetical protein